MLENFFSALRRRLKKRVFIAALAFAIFYFIFQLLFWSVAKYLNDTYYIDKFAHFFFGYVLFSFWYIFMLKNKISKADSALSAFLFVLFAGLLKEYLDLFVVSGVFSYEDLLANLAGIALFYIVDRKTLLVRNKN